MPAGYVPDDTEYLAPETPDTVVIALRADGSAAAADDQALLDVPKMGFHYERPEKYAHLKGTLSPGGGFLAQGLLRIEWEYYAVAPERIDEYFVYGDDYIDAFMNEEELPEAPDPSWMSGREHAYLYSIFAIDGNRGEEELCALLRTYNGPYYDDFSRLEKIVTDGDTSFYLGQYAHVEERMDEYREVMGDFFPEFEDLYQDKETFLSAFRFKRSLWPSELEIGGVLSFETTDLDGNPVRSEELFAESKVTMLNLWGTWCAPCKEELPMLAAMAKEYEAQGLRIVGICNDALQEGKTELARQLLQDAGAEYLCLIGSPELDEYLQIASFPTTFLVDSEGRLLREPIRGAKIAAYRAALDSFLAGSDR